VRAKDALGRYGEDVAARHLTDTGLVVLSRNWRCPEGEIDIVARDGDVLVICEVKTRRGTAHGTPVEAVTWRKADRLRVLAQRWLQSHSARPRAVRFDVVGVLAGRSGAATVDHRRGVI
jgi:putative endonuclease